MGGELVGVGAECLFGLGAIDAVDADLDPWMDSARVQNSGKYDGRFRCCSFKDPRAKFCGHVSWYHWDRIEERRQQLL